MKNSIIFFVFLLFLNKICLAQEPGLSVKPVRLFYTLVNGQAAAQTVYISNNTPKAQQFRLYFEDWTRDSTGGHIYSPAGTLTQSCARWAQINKEFIDLKAGESTEVLVKLQIPDSIEAMSAMKWTMLFIETTQEKLAPSTDKGVHTNVSNITRIGVHIVETPPNLTDKQLTMISFKASTKDPRTYSVICQNTGNVQFDCNTYMELSSVATGEKTTIKKNNFPLFPDQVRRIDYQIPENLAKGKYTAVAVVDGGDDIPLQASQLDIEII